MIVFGTAGSAHDELLVHKVLLLLLAIPIPEFDLLADHSAEPCERIPAAGEGRHSTNLFVTGRAAHAYCGHLVIRGRIVDSCIDEETDLGVLEPHFDGIPVSFRRVLRGK